MQTDRRLADRQTAGMQTGSRPRQTGGWQTDMRQAGRQAGGWQTDGRLAYRHAASRQTGRRLADRQTAGIQTCSRPRQTGGRIHKSTDMRLADRDKESVRQVLTERQAKRLSGKACRKFI
jgi:hypothetical protein